MDAALLTNKIAFSTKINVRCGKGVNIFSGAQWGTHQSLLRSHYIIKYMKEFLVRYPMSNESASYIKNNLTKQRVDFLAITLNRIISQRKLDYDIHKIHFKEDLKTYRSITRALRNKFLSKKKR